MKILITGASGFIGCKLSYHLSGLGYDVISADKTISFNLSWGRFKLIDILKSDLVELLKGTDVVIHLAARVHIMKERAKDPLFEYRKINVDGSIRLAEAAVKNRIRRFIFLSTAKVNGERTNVDRPLKEEDPPRPEDPYSISKLEAENKLKSIIIGSGTELVIIRPPLVYGPGVKGNMKKLIDFIKKGVPLPLGCVRNNKRSYLALENLISFISLCLSHPNAANETFFVSDGEDISTTDLICRLAKAMGVKARLIPLPIPVLKTFGYLFNKQEYVNRLVESFRVDISKAKKLLNWKPVISPDEAFKRMTKNIISHNYD